MMMKRIAFVVLACAFGPAAGCTRYFRVTDPASGRTYYTNQIGRTRTGAVQFRDLKENAEITLQSSEVKQIQKSDLPAPSADTTPAAP